MSDLTLFKVEPVDLAEVIQFPNRCPVDMFQCRQCERLLEVDTWVACPHCEAPL